MKGRGALLVLLGSLAACRAPCPAPEVLLPGTEQPRHGDEIVAAGRLFHVGVPVVLWLDPGGYDAYRTGPRFAAELSPEQRARVPAGQRYGERRPRNARLAARVARDGWTLANLREQIDQFVLHYDVAGTSRQCFKILQDLRGLSVHFLLDVDGTIYQTLDLKERAWHATRANDRSIGIEIAQIGAYDRPDHPALRTWYTVDEAGPRIRFPSWMRVTGIADPTFVARPARREPVHGVIQGRELWQYDFTEEQYRSLIRLSAALHRLFPKIRLDYPRDSNGDLVTRALDEAAWRSYRGLLGHFHVQTNKIDPGPAFDWQRVVEGARRLLFRD